MDPNMPVFAFQAEYIGSPVFVELKANLTLAEASRFYSDAIESGATFAAVSVHANGGWWGVPTSALLKQALSPMP